MTPKSKKSASYSDRGKSVQSTTPVSVIGTAKYSAGESRTSAFEVVGRAVSERFFKIATAGGFAAVAGLSTLSAATFMAAERDAFAEDYEVPASLIPFDLHDAILPALGVAAIAIAVYGVAALSMLVLVLFRKRQPADPERHESRRRRQLANRFTFGRDKVSPPAVERSLPAVALLTLFIASLTVTYEAGDSWGHMLARHGKVFQVLLDPKWCPPRSPTSHADCVIVASGNGKTLTRWIDVDTGQFGSTTATWSSLGDGAISTTLWFHTVRPATVDTAR